MVDRQRLVDDNLPFVRGIAAKVKEGLAKEIEYDDLVAYGTQGLIEAAKRYDPSHGVAFTTFAYYRVRGAMYDGLRGMGWIPRGEYAKHRADERAGTFVQSLSDRGPRGDGADPLRRWQQDFHHRHRERDPGRGRREPRAQTDHPSRQGSDGEPAAPSAARSSR